MAVYQYERLSNPGDIRVLHLLPGRHSDTLSGDIEHSNLDDPKCEYEALSYEWGRPEKTHVFHLQDGHFIRITSALHDALRDLRREPPSKRHRTIWADGICIDQDNKQELEKQVAIMGTIYRTARRVVTYIGPERDGSSTAIEFVRTLHHDCHPATVQHRPWYLRILQWTRPPAGVKLPPLSDPRWAAAKSLLSRGWASRCWCAQEFLLNPNLIMMCGRVEMPDYDCLLEVVRLTFIRALPAHLLPSSSEDPNAPAECLYNLGGMRYTVSRSQTPLLTLLIFSHPFRATNPLDKIYSLLGLASDQPTLRIPIDYTLRPETLYTTVATLLLAHSPSISLLHHSLPTKSLPLPSWVPDWSTWVYGTTGVTGAAAYCASGRTRFHPTVYPTGARLDLPGCLVDKITRLGSPIGPHYARLGEQWELVKTLKTRYDDSALVGVFWRTLVGGCTFHGPLAGEEYRGYFDAHVEFDKDSAARERERAREFIDAVRRKSRSRRLATTGMGYLGAVPEAAEVGDWVCMFHGGPSLYLVREREPGRWVYLGLAYVQGLMQGEVLEKKWYKESVISLV
ncbi:heterokaryon incompatibility protein-domain-containing protein [Lasiosphaeris hirsuta]|uniref:Heterokaryon incompatibility protein-domain-containing protein n=1 Tax=Lasiosphaeris hirsuta TaxID=260670 RepID=A0AA40DLR3_9PEZI|nr:heterokaryon incompatibility protein-domain-containing protein [Lasiosphaeris hirsuta]